LSASKQAGLRVVAFPEQSGADIAVLESSLVHGAEAELVRDLSLLFDGSRMSESISAGRPRSYEIWDEALWNQFERSTV